MRARPAVAIGLVGAAAAAVVIVLSAGSSRRDVPAVVIVDTTHPAHAVPRSFLGLSIEYQSVPRYMGTPAAPNRAFTGLSRGLAAAQRGPVGLRIGGNSSDQSWWNPARLPRPHGVLYDVGPAWVRSVVSGQRALRAPMALGLNLALDDPSNATGLVRAVRNARPAAPGLQLLEIGNEPDLYPRARRFRVGDLIVVRTRKRLRYSASAYVREASDYAQALRRRLGSDPVLSAGGFATRAWAELAIPRLLAAESGVIGELVAHAYPLTGCDGAADPANLRARLLSDEASRGLVHALAPYLGHGLPVRVSEVNSAVCGGVAGVSDTFAAALWAPDALFALLRAGARQADVHTWDGALYAPFAFAGTREGQVARVRPLYYGLLLFARAAPAGSRLLPVRLRGAGAAVRAWATQGPGTQTRVLLLNRDARDARELRVRLVGRNAGTASLERLRSPGLDARRGVSLAGQAFAATTASGELPRRRVSEAVQMRGGQLRLRLPAASAALLVVS